MKINNIFILVCMMVMSFYSSAECAVYYVKDTGDDNASGLTDKQAWKTIKKVNMSSLKNKDTICFKRGSTFADTTLLSPNADDITFMDYGEGEKPRIDGNSICPVKIAPASKIYGLTIKNIDIGGQNWLQTKSSNLYITNVEGLIIDGVIGDGHMGDNTSDGKNAIAVLGCSGKIVITNCKLKNWGPTSQLTMGQDFMGIVVSKIINGSYEISNNLIFNITADAIHLSDNTANGVVKNNAAFNCGENAIDVKGTSNCLIAGNEFYKTNDYLGEGGSGSGGVPVYVVVHEGYANSVCSDNIIQANKFHGGDARGVLIADADGTKIIDNKFVDVMSAIYIGNHSYRTIVQNNVVVNPMHRYGYSDMDAGCIFENNSGVGTKILNNTLFNYTGTAKHLISLACSYGTEISKNIVYQNNTDGAALLLYYLSCGDPPVINNNCWYNKSNINRIKYKRVIYALQDEQEWASWHPGDIFSDPLFKDPENLDLQLKPSSPCQSDGVMWGASQQ